MIQLAPSLLAADFLNLWKAVEVVNSSADLFHMDVMDGVQVPNISFGFPVVNAVAAKAQKPLDVHLMICSPERYALKFAAIEGVGMVSFHLEALEKPAALLEELRKAGVKAGLAVNPDFPVGKLFPYLEHCDFVLMMSVFAGFGGQKFIEETYSRVSEVKAEIVRRSLPVLIEVDGGVCTANAAALRKAGVDIFVAGSAVFAAGDPCAEISAMRSAAQSV